MWLKKAVIVVGVVRSLCVISAEDIFDCELTRLNVNWVVDTTSSMRSLVTSQLEGESGVPYTLMTQTSQEVSDVRTSIFSFEDKPIAPLGAATDTCFGSQVLLMEQDPVDVAAFAFTAGGDGGDEKQSQLDGLYSGMVFLASFLDSLRRGMNVDYFSPLPSDLPPPEDALQYQNVFVLVTNSEAHVETDGPSGFPQPPYNSLYNCDSTSYPNRRLIFNMMLDNNFKLVVLTSPRLEAVYESFFSEIGNLLKVTTFDRNPRITLQNVREAVGELACLPACEAENFNVQFLHLQDISFSYTNDLPNLQVLLPSVLTELNNDFNEVEMALAVFSDKPVGAFGQPGIDVCYDPRVIFTTDQTAIETALNNLQILSGRDWEESSTDGIVGGATDSSLGWEDGFITADGFYKLRVISVATDAGFHKEGDWSNATSPDFQDAPDCKVNDYYSLSAVRRAYEAKDFYPLFLTTSDVTSIYTGLLSDLNLGRGSVRRLADDSSNIVEAIKSGMQEICRQATRTARKKIRFVSV